MAFQSEISQTEELNLTPMIDVVFNLLVFFLLGSTFVNDEQKLELELPRVQSAAPLTEAPDELTVNVLADGTIKIGEETLTLAGLASRLKAAVANYPEQGVAVRGDGNGRYEAVAKVISQCRSAGVKHLDVLVNPEE